MAEQKIMISLLLCAASIFLFVQLSGMASGKVNVENCRCHEIIEPIPPPIIKNCNVCHSMHGGLFPTNRNPPFVHNEHQNTVTSGRSDKCGSSCHQAPVGCQNCHPLHNTRDIRKDVNQQNMNNTSISQYDVSNCNDCHGRLPEPRGHVEFIDALSKSKHQWMNCRSCHINSMTDDRFRLHYKDLFSVSINESEQLCKICHSLQYARLQEGTHGAKDKTCVDCHSPHTTKLKAQSQLSAAPPAQTPTNIRTGLESTKGWIAAKIPILNNPWTVMIIIISAVITVSEYVLSMHEKGTKIAYNTIKISADEDSLMTLDIKLKDQNTDAIKQVLEIDGINILGMTMTKEKDSYKCVLFVDISGNTNIKENLAQLTDKISSIENVKSADFTDEHEL